jgi:DNA-binding NarL/FixJ family response regulator
LSTVLIADDYAAFRSFLRLKLGEKGFRSIVEAEDGLDAVAKAMELQPDLVLLDIAMPKLSGIEAAARIGLVAPQTKVLFVSLSTDSDIVQSALREGARGYVLKSRIEHELLPAIEAVLQGKRFISPDLYPA